MSRTPVAGDPSLEHVPDDGLGRGAHDERLLELGRGVRDEAIAVRVRTQAAQRETKTWCQEAVVCWGG